MGCLKNVFAMIGFATVLVIGGAAAWHYRAEIADWVVSVSTPETGAESSGVESLGVASPEARREARRKAAAMELRDGPPTVQLSADEVAVLFEEAFTDEAREMTDSLVVILGLDAVVIEGVVNTDLLAREVLGRLGGALSRTERFTVAGDLLLIEEGLAEWTPTSFRIGLVPVPQPLLGPLVNSLGGGTQGTLGIPVPTTIEDVRVRPDGLTLYRRF